MHCWAAESSACFVSKSSQWVTSRRKCRHSISMGLSHGLYVGKYSKTNRPAAARTTSSTSSSSWVLALSQATETVPVGCLATKAGTATGQSPYDACGAGTGQHFLLCDSSPLQSHSLYLAALVWESSLADPQDSTWPAKSETSSD
jgi:hypothetical protein